MSKRAVQPIRQGSIIWAKLLDVTGRMTTKPHAVVIVTPDNEISDAEKLDGVGVTSTPHPSADPRLLVELPWHRDGRVCTGFTRRCYAACNWIVHLPRAEAEPSGYYVSDEHLEAILERVATPPSR